MSAISETGMLDLMLLWMYHAVLTSIPGHERECGPQYSTLGILCRLNLDVDRPEKAEFALRRVGRNQLLGAAARQPARGLPATRLRTEANSGFRMRRQS